MITSHAPFPGYNEDHDKALKDINKELRTFGGYWSEFNVSYGDWEYGDLPGARDVISTLAHTKARLNYEYSFFIFRTTFLQKWYGYGFKVKTESVIQDPEKYIEMIKQVAQDIIDTGSHVLDENAVVVELPIVE